MGLSPSPVEACDLNRDGFPDLVVGNTSSASVSIVLSDGLGGFAVQPAVTVGASPNATATGGGGTVSVLQGNGTGGFSPAATFGTGPSFGPQPFSLSLADFNRDGIPDLLVGDNNNNNNPSVMFGR